jgi:zinc protease
MTHPRRCLALLGLTVALVLGPPLASAAPRVPPRVEIKEWKLANGLRVLFSRRSRVPGVSVQVWYHAGSKDESRSQRGIAHLFEHMMFKGSDRVPPEEHARILDGLGGSTNAFTTQDLTAYHDTLPRQYLELAMSLEAERMRHLHLTEHTIRSEREVVKEEKRMRIDNSPVGRALEAIYDMAYTKHPYAWTPAGDIAALDKVTTGACRGFYDTYYTPRNATLVVVGDVEEKEVRGAAERTLGGIPGGADPPRVAVVEPVQTAPREHRGSWPSQLKVVLGAYHIPEAAHADIAPLRVASAVLSDGQSSRLHQTLVRKGKLALNAGGFVLELEQPGLLMVYAVGLPTHDLGKMQRTLLEEVEKIAASGVRPEELTKAKNQLATQSLSALRTLEGLAMQIGMSAIVRGDPRAFLEEPERIDRVTAEDVRRVASTYLVRKNLSLITFGETAVPASKSGGSR